jgi:hypothetical protein
MADQNLQIDIDDQSVSVRLDVSKYSPHRRFCVCIFYIALLALAVCVLLFAPLVDGAPSMWQDLSTYPVNSGTSILALVVLVGSPLLIFLLLRRYMVFAYPSDETFRCDRATVTVSRVRWFDFNNKHWDTRSYALGEIGNLRYEAIAEAKWVSIYGLRFSAGGGTQRVLPGLKPRDADKILKALKVFGVDIPDDPESLKKLAEDAEDHWNR